MNKEDIEEFKKEKEHQEENLIMNAIHKNARKKHDEYIMRNNIRKIKQERRARNSKRLAYILCTVLLVAFVVLANKYTDNQVSSCIKSGNSASFCENNLR